MRPFQKCRPNFSNTGAACETPASRNRSSDEVDDHKYAVSNFTLYIVEVCESPMMGDRTLPRNLFSLVILFAIVGFSGCDTTVKTDYSKLGLVDVSGTVTLDGQPLSGATVIFETPDMKYSYGETDSSGNYTMMFNSEQSGVTTGHKTVRIVTGTVGDEGEGGEEEEGQEEAVSTSMTVPACYNKKSSIEVEVESSGTFNFDLKSDCSTSGPT